MPTKVYWLHQFNNGARIGIMPRPRGGDWLKDEIRHLKRQHVTLLVSLLETAEIYELELCEEEEECIKNGISFRNYPIKDRGVPSNTKTFIGGLLQNIKNGEAIVIHCRMGIGRASIIAGNILLMNGYSTNEVIKIISDIRGLKVPDTDEQIAWLKNQENNITE